MIETKQLQYFLKCSELESFSRAADELHTTQPNISKVIKSLEDELGLELFLRLKNGIKLNEDGKEVYQYAREAMQNIQQIENFVKNLKEMRKLKSDGTKR